MGQEKHRMMEAEERGWWSGDGRHVCNECVEVPELQAALDEAAEAEVCDFCGRSADHPIAAPFDLLIELIAEALMTRYGDGSGTPYSEGDYIVPTLSTYEVLNEIEFGSTPEVWDAVVNAFTIQVWVQAPGGHWAKLPLSKELSSAWEHFSWVVRHQTRFHFHKRLNDDPHDDGIAPADMLDAIGRTIETTALIKEIPACATFYRGRIMRPGSAWIPSADSMGAPPPEVATAGRMNPAGIPYLYLAFDVNTMVAEMGALRENEVVYGAAFRTKRALRVVDFSDLPVVPSLFDPDRRPLYEHLTFLHEFADEISRPVERPRPEEIHYVPTQVMSEYLAQGFVASDGAPIDGMIYPSAQNPEGRNLVLFPSREVLKPPFDCVEFVEVFDWQQVLSMMLGPVPFIKGL